MDSEMESVGDEAAVACIKLFVMEWDLREIMSNINK
jgi:hypothetical protein